MNGKRAKLLKRQAKTKTEKPSGHESIKRSKRFWDIGEKKWKYYTQYTGVCTGLRADYLKLKKNYKAGIA